MKKFTLKALTLAAASICGTAAIAGSISAPATDAAATKYAVEALVNTTDITLPAITYTMGVTRTPAQDFTIIYKPSAGAAFAACPTAPAAFTIAGTGAATVVVSNKRSGPTECAYEVDVGTDAVTGTDLTTTITINGLVLTSHTLATAGNSASVSLGLWELSEYARIDNTGDLSRTVAVSGNALKLSVTQDTETTTNVNDAAGPLYGFVVDGNDAQYTARASYTVDNNSADAYMIPDGVTPWDFALHGTKLTVSVAGNFQGLDTDGYTVSGPLGAKTATVAAGVAKVDFVPADFTMGTGLYSVLNHFTATGTESLGTARTFGVSALADVVTGADETLGGGSASWWVWDANASQLMTPYFTTNGLFLSRFFFLNTGSTSVGYTAQCYSETGNAITYGTAKTGTLSASGQTAVNAKDVCSFAGNTRGAVIFTINAPIESVKGSYQAVDPVSLNNSVTPLVRPYATAQTTE